MSSKSEKLGFALGKAFKNVMAAAKDEPKSPEDSTIPAGPPMYRTNIRNVEKVESLPREDGWVDMQVQFLIDKKSAGANHVVGWTVLKPGARHERHRHRNCDEFFIVIKGRGHIYSDLGEEPSVEGDVVYSPRGCWHGFNNTSDEDVVLVWGWMDAGSIEDSGYEVDPSSHKS
jgi:quercetin dioxygenase-like cupin family protein